MDEISDDENWEQSLSPESRAHQDYDEARRLLRVQKPYLLIGSPECKAFSTWMRLNRAKPKDPAAVDRARVRAQLHINFVVELYRERIDGGRYFLHEHPLLIALCLHQLLFNLLFSV